MQTDTKAVVRCLVLIPALVVTLFLPALARADVWTLGDWAANVDGNTSPSVNTSGYDFTTGLGTLTFTLDATAAHYAGIYVYIYDDNGFGDNSTAYANPNGADGVTWQLGSPGQSVFTNFAANALDGSNTVGAYSPPPNACCSVVMAMLASATADPGFNDVFSFTVGTGQPGGFYLQETDHDTGNSVYLSGSVTQTPSGPTVPEPDAIWLLLTFCASTAGISRAWKVCKRE